MKIRQRIYRFVIYEPGEVISIAEHAPAGIERKAWIVERFIPPSGTVNLDLTQDGTLFGHVYLRGLEKPLSTRFILPPQDSIPVPHGYTSVATGLIQQDDLYFSGVTWIVVSPHSDLIGSPVSRCLAVARLLPTTK